MTYKLNALGRETIRNFVKNNADSNKCMDGYFEEAEAKANKGNTGFGAVWLEMNQTIHRYEVLLILNQEHYDNA